MKTLPILALVAFTIGCRSNRLVNYQVRFESDPPGARVFLSLGATSGMAAKNRSYLGTTPCTATITGTRNGYIYTPKIAYASDYVPGSATFIAEPPHGTEGQFTQTQTYRGTTEWAEGDRIPQAVFFDMRKPPATEP